jgi:myosin-5
LLAGCPSSDLKSIGLDDAANFFYMNQGGAAAKTIPGVDDAAELKATEKALDTVGITSSTRWQIFQLLGALLHIGNVEIKQTRSDAFISEDDPHIKYVVDLLGIDAAEYKRWTVKKQITTRSEKIVTALTSAQAIVVRDSVAKFIYACLFDWLVSIINDSLAKNHGDVASFIGVLDIYGFEHFSKHATFKVIHKL